MILNTQLKSTIIVILLMDEIFLSYLFSQNSILHVDISKREKDYQPAALISGDKVWADYDLVEYV